MSSIKHGKPFTLKDLITEKTGHGGEASDFDYVEKEVIPAGTVPEFYGLIKEYMGELGQVETRLRWKAKVKNNPFFGAVSSMYGLTMRLLEGSQQGITVDDLVNEQISIMGSLNKNVQSAISHSSVESGRLQDYADKVMEDFESSKKGMQQSDDNYHELQRMIGHFESNLLHLNMDDDGYTVVRKSYDDAKRGLQKAQNVREGYASRVKVRLAQRKTALVKEEIVRTVLYELQKMGDHLGMFLEEVENTADATALSQYAYQTAEALRDSYRTLSDISESRSIISKSNVGRLMKAVNDTNYDFPQELLKAGIEEDRELREARNSSAFREVKDLLSKPAFEQEHDFGTYNRNGYHHESADLLETL